MRRPSTSCRWLPASRPTWLPTCSFLLRMVWWTVILSSFVTLLCDRRAAAVCRRCRPARILPAEEHGGYNTASTVTTTTSIANLKCSMERCGVNPDQYKSSLVQTSTTRCLQQTIHRGAAEIVRYASVPNCASFCIGKRLYRVHKRTELYTSFHFGLRSYQSSIPLKLNG